MTIEINGRECTGITCDCCHKEFFVDMGELPHRGCWTCPYCTCLMMDNRVKDADVIKLKLKTFTREMEDSLQAMNVAISNFDKD